MKVRKISALLLTAALILSLLGGCSSGNDKDPLTPSDDISPSVETPTAPGESGTRTITDMAGREVEIPATVNTVAALGATARILVYAGCEDKIVGLTDLEKKGDAGMPYCYVNSEKFANLTSIATGGASSENYEETIATLKPDVIFSNYTDTEQVNTMQSKLGIPVVSFSFQGIFSDSVYEALNLVGEVMGAQERCTELVATMKGWQKDLNERTKDIADEDKPSVYVGAVSFSGGHGIEGTYGQYPPFVAINAKNVVDETGEKSSVLIDKEKLVVWNPDILFLTPGNMQLVNEDYKTNPNLYNNLKAVKNGEVYTQISYNYYGTNIELAIVNAYYAASIIYPEQFSDVDFEMKADEIFTKMLGAPYMQVLQDTSNGFGKITIGE